MCACVGVCAGGVLMSSWDTFKTRLSSSEVKVEPFERRTKVLHHRGDTRR